VYNCVCIIVRGRVRQRTLIRKGKFRWFEHTERKVGNAWIRRITMNVQPMQRDAQGKHDGLM